MQTGHPALDAMIKVSSIPSDEPCFILRAQDPAAPVAVRAWAGEHMKGGGSPANAESAFAQADRMDAWPVKKIPGDDHWSPEERKDLEYRFGRRAHHASLTSFAPDPVLSERVGHDLAVGRFRVFLGSHVALKVLSLSDTSLNFFAERRAEPGATPDRAATLAWLLRLAFEQGERWNVVAQREIDSITRRRANV